MTPQKRAVTRSREYPATTLVAVQYWFVITHFEQTRVQLHACLDLVPGSVD